MITGSLTTNKKKSSPYSRNDHSNYLRLHNTLIIIFSAYILFCFLLTFRIHIGFPGIIFNVIAYVVISFYCRTSLTNPGRGDLYYQIIVGLGKRSEKTNCNLCTFINNKKNPFRPGFYVFQIILYRDNFR